MDAAVADVVREFGAKLRSRSSDYNCVGMALANRRAFVDPEHLNMILEEDGYHPVNEADVVPGDLALYSQGAEFVHVGIVVEHSADVENAQFNTLVLSQWGPFGEYFHELRRVSTGLGKPAGFWTERLP